MTSRFPFRAARGPAHGVVGVVAIVLIVAGARIATASVSAISPTAQGAVSGGGTVTNPCGDASFGLNSVRPNTFPGGQALGRVNYDPLRRNPNARVHLPGVVKSVTGSAKPTPNGRGGDPALLPLRTTGDTTTALPTGAPPR